MLIQEFLKQIYRPCFRFPFHQFRKRVCFDPVNEDRKTENPIVELLFVAARFSQIVRCHFILSEQHSPEFGFEDNVQISSGFNYSIHKGIEFPDLPQQALTE